MAEIVESDSSEACSLQQLVEYPVTDIIRIEHGARLVTENPFGLRSIVSERLQLLIYKVLLQHISEPAGHIHSPALAIFRCGHSAVGEIPPNLNKPAVEIEIAGLEGDRFAEPTSRPHQGQEERVIGRDVRLYGIEKDRLFLPREWIDILRLRLGLHNLPRF